MAERYYPVGIQTFKRLRKDGFVYIDKTDLVWKMQQGRTFVFLSRPRRFGKSLLSSTLHSYFAGEREWFEGLKIMQYEKEWKSYPVLHIDLSTAKYEATATDLQKKLMLRLMPFVKMYGSIPEEGSPGGLLQGLIERAYEQTGKQVVLIIDEYDAPLLESLHEDEVLKEKRRVMQEFYVPLKTSEPMIKFCFITGITKFSQLSIFSTINNLTNLTMQPEFSAICGITEEELVTQMCEDIAMMAEANGYSYEEMHERLKMRYDGYHFSENSPEVYNPFSLLKAFDSKKLSNYWFESGTPTFLIRQMEHYHTDITTMDDLTVSVQAFDRPTEAMTNALPLLYQSGYLTIKDYDRLSEQYTLSIPNQEVRVGFADGLLPVYTGLEGYEVQSGFALKFWRALRQNDVDLAMREMQAYLAGIPYVEGFKKKLAEAATAEGFYEYTMYLIFSMLNVYVRTQVKCRAGRIDMVVQMPDTTYVFELKVEGTAQDALSQINTKDYSIAYKTEGCKVVKVGVKFDVATRTPESWVVAE